MKPAGGARVKLRVVGADAPRRQSQRHLPFVFGIADAHAGPLQQFDIPIPASPVSRILRVEIWPGGSRGLRVTAPAGEPYALRLFLGPF